jgi:hypothetical protein
VIKELIEALEKTEPPYHPDTTLDYEMGFRAGVGEALETVKYRLGERVMSNSKILYVVSMIEFFDDEGISTGRKLRVFEEEGNKIIATTFPFSADDDLNLMLERLIRVWSGDIRSANIERGIK